MAATAKSGVVIAKTEDCESNHEGVKPCTSSCIQFHL
jgi:hypothetical protein